MYAQLEAWLEGDVLRGQIAREDDGLVSGFVLYYPIERAPLDVTGEGLYMVQCVTVKPEFRGRGVGRALVESALSDARANGASGLAVEAFRGERRGEWEYMPSTFFDHMGLAPGPSRGSATLYYKRFGKSKSAPAYLDPKFSPPARTEPGPDRRLRLPKVLHQGAQSLGRRGGGGERRIGQGEARGTRSELAGGRTGQGYVQRRVRGWETDLLQGAHQRGRCLERDRGCGIGAGTADRSIAPARQT